MHICLDVGTCPRPYIMRVVKNGPPNQGLCELKFWLLVLFFFTVAVIKTGPKGYFNHCVSCSFLLTWLNELGAKTQEMHVLEAQASKV